MIPKVIHYCWFGGKELPRSAVKCIKSWQKFLPDYKIVRWDESNFDINICQYTKEAYECKKYAFVSDYARFYILYNHGGLYFDTDVELIRPMTHIIAAGPFMGCESQICNATASDEKHTALELGINPGLGLGANAGMELYAEILEKYRQLTFINTDGSQNLKTVVEHVTGILCDKGLKPVNDIQTVAGIKIYPKEYFCPMDYYSRRLDITPNTVSIHHYDASWYPWKPSEKLYYWIRWNIGADFARNCAKVYKFLRR